MAFFLLDIITWLDAHQLPCMFKTVTHFDCPGCGIQRSFILLMRGDVTGSLLLYPALMPIILLFMFLILHVSIKIKQGAKILKFGYIFCVSVMLVSYIYKLVIIKLV